MSENISKGLTRQKGAARHAARRAPVRLHGKVFCDSIEKLREQQQQQRVEEKAKRNIKIKLKSLLNLVAGCKQCVARSALRLALFAALWRVDGQINCISDAALRFCIRNRIMPNQTADSAEEQEEGEAAGLAALLLCLYCACALD